MTVLQHCARRKEVAEYKNVINHITFFLSFSSFGLSSHPNFFLSWFLFSAFSSYSSHFLCLLFLSDSLSYFFLPLIIFFLFLSLFSDCIYLLFHFPSLAFSSCSSLPSLSCLFFQPLTIIFSFNITLLSLLSSFLFFSASAFFLTILP